MTITPDLIPHTEFHTGIWLLSTRRPEWYYFMKKKNVNHISAPAFIKTVDRPLRGLVKFLHKHGIKTTPSCSGHHIRERDLDTIYSALEKDRTEIINEVLRLKDVETGEIYFYRDKNYQLPWMRQEFIDRVSIYQQKGVIGLRLDHHEEEKARLLKLKISGITIEERDGIVFLFTDGENKGDNQHIWRRATRAVKKLLKEAVTISLQET